MYEGSNQMSEHKNNKLFHMPGKPSKKASIAPCLCSCARRDSIHPCLLRHCPPDSRLGECQLHTTDAKDIPRAIEKDVIPEYRELERALGCVVDGKVYIVVTRGEKPTAGYDLSIEKVNLEKTGDGSTGCYRQIHRPSARQNRIPRNHLPI